MSDDRDLALAESEAAGVIVAAGFDGGHPVYRLRAFPPARKARD